MTPHPFVGETRLDFLLVGLKLPTTREVDKPGDNDPALGVDVALLLPAVTYSVGSAQDTMGTRRAKG